MSLNLFDEHAQMGKISNNLEIHGEEEVPAFAIPFTVTLTEELLDGLMGKYFWRSLYASAMFGNPAQPIEGFRRCKPLELEDIFEGVTATLAKVLGTERIEHDFKGCKVQKIVLEPQTGGLTLAKLQLYLHPGLDQQNLWLQELQNTEVSIKLTEGKISAKKNPKQTEMHLPPAEGEKPAVDASTDSGDVSEFEAGAQAQIAAFTAKPGEVIDGRSERVKHSDAQKTGTH